ncbi:MAG: Asp-tRNA(Asn)/Glu-tRNA(Gln) amidotransferase subunit GatB [Anaerovoracaceae bacterium]|jgi:aspartyl-tRNA(Asn)/glutamyl-tRNA(Gln) amidotransferase subunit B
MKYEVVMGLEVHVEMSTESKLFCSCPVRFGAEANENVCPACLGMPGFLPLVNKKAVELGIRAALVTNSEIVRETSFDKKNYFYPDLPTGYQTTQLYSPICKNGFVEIETGEGVRRIGIEQIHIEEDAGKLIHENRTDSTLIDYNRAGVPLIEIVSRPDFRNGEQVIAYLEKLRLLLMFAGVSDCKMEEGSMRADINISVREKGSNTLGVRTEIKNMNSLKAISRAIAYEAERHMDALDGGQVLIQETRRWDDNKNMSFPMRSKEDVTDYRYFPDSDIMPIRIDGEWIESIKNNLPESAGEKYERYLNEFGLSESDSRIISGDKGLAWVYDETVGYCGKPKDAASWIVVELMGMMNADGKSVDQVNLKPDKLAKLIDMVADRKVSRIVAKDIFAEIYKRGVDPEDYAKQHGLIMVSDQEGVRAVAEKLIAENPKSVQEYKEGKGKVVGFFVGRIMREMKGKADPAEVNSILKELLDKA